MNYQIQENMLREIPAQFALPAPEWRPRALYILFSVLGLLVIVGCTFLPSATDIVILLGGLAVCTGAILRPRLALQIVFIGAGLPALLIPLPGHNMRPVEVGLWLCLLVIILWRPPLRLRLPHLLALLFLAIGVISFIHAPTFSSGLGAYTADKRLFGDLLAVLALFCGAFLFKYIKDISAFLVIVLLSNLPIYLIALAQALKLHVPTIIALSDPTQSEGRLPGPFAGAIGFSMYLVNLFAIALACWLVSKRKRDRLIGIGMTLITALALIGSGTRSAAIAAAVIVVVSFTLTRRFKLLIGIFVIAGGVAIVFFNKILPLFTHDPTSASNRLFLWQTAINLIASHMWIGIGMWNFPKYYALLIVSQGSQLNSHGGVSIHEQYLEWGMESGIFWMIVGVLLLLSITYICWQAYRVAARKQQVLLLAATLAMLANIVIGFFDVPLDETEGTIVLFLLAGLALSCAAHTQGRVRYIAWSGGARTQQRIARAGIASVLYWPQPVRQVSKTARIQLKPAQEVKKADVAGETANVTTHSAPNVQKTGYSVVIQLLSWALPIPLIFPMTALLTRYLGPVQYGEYSFTLSVLAILVLFCGNGIDPLVLRQLSKKPRAEWREILSYAIGTRVFVISLVVGATILAVLLLPMSEEQRNLLLIGSISLFFSFSLGSLHTTFEIGFRLEQRVSLLSIITTIDRIVTAGLVGLIVYLHLPLLWACCIIIYSDIPFFLIQLCLARRDFGIQLRFNFTRARELFLSSLPLIGYNIMFLIAAQADLLLLMALVGAQSVGIYALASRITDPLLSIVLAYAIGLYPLFCSKFSEGREQFATVYHESVRILALVIIPLSLIVSAEAEPIVALLGGQSFIAATTAVRLLMWAMAVTFFNQLAVRACMSAHLEKRMMYVTVGSSIVNIVANLVLIPYWHIIGAGVAALAGELVGFCLLTYLLRPHVHLSSNLSMILRICAGNIPMLLFLIWQQKASALLVVPLALLLTLCGCILTRTISIKDVALLRNVVYSRRKRKEQTTTRNRLDDDITDLLPMIDDIAEQPTLLLPVIESVADGPTLVLPRIKL